MTPIVKTYDFIWPRFRDRMKGLTDDEYFWEPVPDSWSLRPGPDGTWMMDGLGEHRDPAPVTTIAWRISHIGECLLTFTGRLFEDAPNLPPPRSAADVDPFLDQCYQRWRDGLDTLSDWGRPLGRAFGIYAKDTQADLVMHVLDELIHHAAEVALLRDLYRHRYR